MKDMNTESLDRLLAQPAQISDGGFHQRVLASLTSKISPRKKVFAFFAAGWLLLAWFTVSPRAIYEDLLRFIESLNYSDSANSINTLAGYLSDFSFTAPSIGYSGTLLLILAIAAIADFGAAGRI